MRAESQPQAFRVIVRCSVCGDKATLAELVAPGERPADWDDWPEALQKIDQESHDPGSWRFIYEGVEAGTGFRGDDVAVEEAARLSRAFGLPLTYDGVHSADLYDDAGFCAECAQPYCWVHWGEPEDGYGRCPRGHGKSLDPHWSPI